MSDKKEEKTIDVRCFLPDGKFAFWGTERVYDRQTIKGVPASKVSFKWMRNLDGSEIDPEKLKDPNPASKTTGNTKK